MAATQHNAELNDLFIQLSRSLLQYVGECWPWVGYGEDEERQRINRLVARQQARIERLADLLSRRSWTIDFGVYPTDFTDLHYVSLDYLLALLVEDKQACIAQTERTQAVCRDDLEAAAVVREILDGEMEDLRDLQELSDGRPEGAAV